MSYATTLVRVMKGHIPVFKRDGTFFKHHAAGASEFDRELGNLMQKAHDAQAAVYEHIERKTNDNSIP